MHMDTSKIFKLNVRDFTMGMIVAAGSAVATYLLGALNSLDFSWSAIDWNEIGRIALVAAIGYLVKNYLSDDKGKFLGSV